MANRTIQYFDGRNTLTDLTLIGFDGLTIENPGELVTDIYGLSTVTTVWKCAVDKDTLIPGMFAYHPIFGWTNMERRRIAMSEGYFVITGEFAGVDGDRSSSVYEMCLGVADEPIETHPKFVTDIGGTPSAPLNGAIFLGPDGKQTFDDEVGQFAYFNHMTQFVGIESYLAADQFTWRERYVSRTRPPSSQVGYITSPSGGPPPSPSNWIQISCNYEQRGLAYFVTNEWRAGGRRGWNDIIYSS